jgi:hypothetical protein
LRQIYFCKLFVCTSSVDWLYSCCCITDLSECWYTDIRNVRPVQVSITLIYIYPSSYVLSGKSLLLIEFFCLCCNRSLANKSFWKKLGMTDCMSYWCSTGRTRNCLVSCIFWNNMFRKIFGVHNWESLSNFSFMCQGN